MINGDKLKKIREEKLMSQKELAADCEVHYVTILNAEKKGVTSKRTLKKLLAILGCTLTDLGYVQ